MKKTHNIVMLSTEKASDLFDKKGTLEYNVNPPLHGIKDLGWKYQHLYLTSTDEIKQGDYYIHNQKPIGPRVLQCVSLDMPMDSVKIIATTDKSLSTTTMLGNSVFNIITVPQIPESFIQAYIKAYNAGTPITEVDLEYTSEIITEQSTERGDFHAEEIVSLKLRPDNTVIIHPSRTYSQAQVEEFGIWLGNNLKQNKGKKIHDLFNEFFNFGNL